MLYPSLNPEMKSCAAAALAAFSISLSVAFSFKSNAWSAGGGKKGVREGRREEGWRARGREGKKEITSRRIEVNECGGEEKAYML